ncbi:MAG: tetratricopeptide repeat protein [Acidimicrobiales bacterium]
MPDVELETPDLDVDPSAPAFKRRVALAVVLITLFGAIVGYLQQQASNHEDNAGRDGQIAAISGLGTQVQASTDFGANYRIFVESELLARRHVIARNRIQTVPAGSLEAERLALDADRWLAVHDVVVPLTALSDEQYQPGGAVDPALLEAELQVGPDIARLEQGVLADRTDDFGSKADSFVAVLTVLAVSLFLLGLSLTVTSRVRYFLAGPGVAIAIVCVGWAIFIGTRDVTDVSDEAIRLTADGTELVNRGEIDDGIERFTDAIRDSPQFAAAFARRSDAHFFSGATQTSTGFISFVDNEARDRAIADGQRAVELGDESANVLGNLGFTLFLDRQFDAAADLTGRALDANDQLASVWFNLGLIELARGDDGDALEAYERGSELIREEVDPGVRSEIVSAARNDLVLLRDLVDARNAAASRVEGALAALEAGLNPPADDDDFADDVDDAEVDGDIDEIDVERSEFDPVFVTATFDRDDIDDDTPLAFIWYYRVSDDDPFEQLPGMKSFQRAGADEQVSASATINECLPAGEYRVDVYAGADHIGSGEAEVEAGPLGLVSNFTDDLDAVTMCAPDDWDLTRFAEVEEFAASQFDGPLFVHPEGAALVGISSFPTTVEARANPEATMDAAIEAALGPVPITDDTLRGTDGETFFDLPARSTITDSDAGVTHVVSSLGPDGVLRVVIVIADGDELVDQIRAEMIDTLVFRRVGSGS